MIKIEHALVAISLALLVVTYHASNIIDELHTEIHELKKQLNNETTRVSYWEHDGEWKKITYREN
jgi:hypothetical protein